MEMKMTNKVVALFVCFGFAAPAAAEVNFDQGVDVKAVIGQAKDLDIKSPYPHYGPHRVRFSRDCKSFNYGPSASAIESEMSWFSSTEYIEQCHFIPNPPVPPVNPPHPPNNPPGHNNNPGHNNPGHPKDFNNGPYTGNDYGPHGHYSYPGYYGSQQGQWQCFERPGQVFRATAQLKVEQRTLYPWERESFEVCMEGPRLDIDTRVSPYTYSVQREGGLDVRFRLIPSYRVPTAPDAEGLYQSAFSHNAGKFTFKANDRWTNEYAGEKVAVKVELYKDGFLFFNSYKGEKEFTFDTAQSYELVFAESDLVQNKTMIDDSMDFRGAKKYYVKWSFRRIGSVSTAKEINKGSTDKIEVK